MNPKPHIELNPVQCPLSGTNLVEASAGTGKTYTIASLVLRLLLEKKLNIGEILVVTFTQAATEELKDRIRSRLRKAMDFFSDKGEGDSFITALAQRLGQKEPLQYYLASALNDFDEAAIYTIHGFCHRVLSDHAFETGQIFDSRLVTDEEHIFERVVCDFWRRELYGAPPEFVSYAIHKKFAVQAFHHLARNVTTWPGVEIVPDVSKWEFPDLEPFREKFSALRERWRGESNEIREILVEADLDGRTYGVPANDKNANSGRGKKIELFMGEVERWLEKDWAVFPPPRAVQRLSIGGLRSSLKRGGKLVEHPLFQSIQEVHDMATCLVKEMDDCLIFLKSGFAKKVAQEIAFEKRRLNVKGYQDLITATKKALEGGKGRRVAASLCKRFKAALIDEFHDTDSYQYFIFRSLFGTDSRPLFLIGDPKQAIYGFRGADIFAYLHATSEVDRKYTLSTNWRSQAPLIKATNTLFKLKRRPFLFDQVGFVEARPSKEKKVDRFVVDGEPEVPLKLWYLREDPEAPSDKPVGKGRAREIMARCVACEISNLVDMGRKGRAMLGDRPLKEGDMAVLVRTNEEALLVQRWLRKFAVFNVLYSGENVFKSHEAWEVKQLMSAIASPEDGQLLRAALSTEVFGFEARDILSLREEGSSWEEMVSRFREYRQLWAKSGFITMLRYLMERERVTERLIGGQDGERKVCNLLQISELLQKVSSELNLGISGLLTWLTEQMEYDGPGLDEQQVRLDTDDDAVKVLTIHKSKGLEFPIVFYPFAWGDWDNRGDIIKFHDPRDNTKLVMDLGSENKEKFEPVSAKELLAENIRLLYVALTRAKSACYVAWGNINGASNSALAYLLCGPDDFSDSDVVHKTVESYQEAYRKGIHLKLAALAEESSGNIEICDPPFVGKTLTREERDVKGLNTRPFTGRIAMDWGVSSFSSLVSGYEDSADMPEHDIMAYGGMTGVDETALVSGTPYESILEFPRGPKAGSFLHKIMEQVDFSRAGEGEREDLVRDLLADYGYEEQWTAAICGMLENTLGASLSEEHQGLKLSLVPTNCRLTELEFYFPMRLITPTDLASIFEGESVSSSMAYIPERIEALEFSPIRGFMKGYIDLVFQWNGKYYLVDWKSNHLGPDIEAYNQGSMEEEMLRHFYVLQCHIYCLALDQYLSLRLPGYDYQRHFGGAFYIFLRGMDAEKAPKYGVYGTRPSVDLIKRLRKGLLETKGS